MSNNSSTMGKDTMIPKALEGLVYHRSNHFENTLDTVIRRKFPIYLGRHEIEPQYDLGVLDKLPLETLSDTLVHLDLRTLMDFRAVSQRAMQVVDSIPQFRTIVNHSPSSLRSILAVEAGSDITCQDLYDTLSSSRCETCNKFGGFIYVLDCSRVCFYCFTKKDRYLPMTPPEVLRSFGIGRCLLKGVRRIKSVPGCYSPNEKTCRTRLVLINRESARCAAISFHGSAVAMQQHVARAITDRLERYRERASRRQEGASGPRPRRPLRRPSDETSCLRRGIPLTFAKCFMAIVHAPSVSMPEGPAEWGFYCVGCRYTFYGPQYNVETFDEHIAHCGPVINGKHCP